MVTTAMREYELYRAAVGIWFAAGVVVFVVLFLKNAPYGRFTRTGWGPMVSSKLGWIVMESPAVLVFGLLFLMGDRKGLVPLVFFAIWNVHYIYRAFVVPCRMRSSSKMPLVVLAGGLVFNVANAYLQARYLFTLSPPYSSGWLFDPRFLVGAILFAGGLAIHVHSDSVLRSLRGVGDEAYRVPHGGLFGWVSSANYFGEIVQWSGWAILTWSPAGLVFALWTAANLVPRAIAYHRWYRAKFPDYPPGRKAVIPFLL